MYLKNQLKIFFSTSWNCFASVLIGTLKYPTYFRKSLLNWAGSSHMLPAIHFGGNKELGGQEWSVWGEEGSKVSLVFEDKLPFHDSWPERSCRGEISKWGLFTCKSWGCLTVLQVCPESWAAPLPCWSASRKSMVREGSSPQTGKAWFQIPASSPPAPWS